MVFFDGESYGWQVLCLSGLFVTQGLLLDRLQPSLVVLPPLPLERTALGFACVLLLGLLLALLDWWLCGLWADVESLAFLELLLPCA